MKMSLYLNRLIIYPIMGKCDVTFRKGLNVIIAEDVTKSIEKETHNNIINDKKQMRNSVGKTTFINLIEYSLGKEKFLKSEEKELLNEFREYYAIMEFSLNDTRYTVKRNIVDEQNVVVFKDWVIESVLEGRKDQAIHGRYELKGYNSFLENALFKGKNYFKNKRLVSYRSVMNFIFRDQFHGFNKYNSGIKQEKATICKERLKFLLELNTEEKLQIEEDISILKDEKKFIDSKYSVINNYLKDIIGKTKTSIKNTIHSNEKEIEKLQVQLQNSNKDIIELEEKKDNLKIEKKRLQNELDSICDDISIINSRISSYEITLNEIKNENYKIEHIKTSIQIFSPFKQYRCQLFDTNIEGNKLNSETCPFFESTEKLNKNKEMINARSKLLKYEKKDLYRALNELKKQLDLLIHERLCKKNCISKINDNIMGLEVKVIEKKDNILNEIRDLEILNKTLEKEYEQYEYLEEIRKEKKNKEEKIKNKKSILNHIENKKIDDIETVYDNIIQKLSNSTRIGKIDFKNLKPSILFENGQKDNGAGMKNAAIIAYDLAILEYALENNKKRTDTAYLNFLVHDSPKKNDMDTKMYNRIFDYIISLENKYFPQNIYFQYIITTLDISDKVLANKEKYIRLSLDNSGDGGKLFGKTINI